MARVQYVALDVVGFTKGRSVEAQSEVVGALNAIVTRSLLELDVPTESTLLLPTGDGIVIALVDATAVDLHLQVALRILAGVALHNRATQERTRQFEIRIGINENVDNVLQDVNGRRNVAGAGISMAQRIMDTADGGQLLAGAAVFEILRQREKYMDAWKQFSARGKHNASFVVHQFVSDTFTGLNSRLPAAFANRSSGPEPLTRYVAFYLAHALANNEFLTSRRNDNLRDYTAPVLLALLAEDSVATESTPPHRERTIVTFGQGKATFSEQYLHYREMEFWPRARLAELIYEHHLKPYSLAFERSLQSSCWLVSRQGRDRLALEFPDIWTQFGLGNVAHSGG